MNTWGIYGLIHYERQDKSSGQSLLCIRSGLTWIGTALSGYLFVVYLRDVVILSESSFEENG